MDWAAVMAMGALARVRKARSHGLGFTLVTDNEKEFTRVRDLARENWLR